MTIFYVFPQIQGLEEKNPYFSKPCMMNMTAITPKLFVLHVINQGAIAPILDVLPHVFVILDVLHDAVATLGVLSDELDGLHGLAVDRYQNKTNSMIQEFWSNKPF